MHHDSIGSSLLTDIGSGFMGCLSDPDPMVMAQPSLLGLSRSCTYVPSVYLKCSLDDSYLDMHLEHRNT